MRAKGKRKVTEKKIERLNHKVAQPNTAELACNKDINFEDRLWNAADKLRKKVEVHEYKYIVLSLIFLRYLSYRYEETLKELKKEFDFQTREATPERKKQLEYLLHDRDSYLSRGVLPVPEKAQWNYILNQAGQPNIAEILDNAIATLEKQYPRQLQDVIPRRFTASQLSPEDLQYLINQFTEIEFGDDHSGKDIFGRIYEYFLGKFTAAEGRKGGEFFTPRILTRLIVEVLGVRGGKIFDPACGSGGFFISALEKMEREGIDPVKLTIYGQDSKLDNWRLCRMNLVIRGIEGDIRIGDSYHDDKFPDLRADYVVSNPPFNDSKWGAERVKPEDPRFKYGIPPDGNGNYAWIQHYLFHLAPRGRAGFVMANGALSSGNQEGEIRRKIIEDDLIYGIIATPPKLFYTVSLPVSLWFCARHKPEHMKGKILFVYAKKMYQPLSRKINIMTEEQLDRIISKFRRFEEGRLDEIDEPGFARVATLDEVARNNFVLTPGRYVGIRIEEDDEPFEEKMKRYSTELAQLLKEERELTEKVKEVFKGLGYKI